MDSWFLVQTKSKQEMRAQENLQRQGLGTFCPLVQVEKLYAGRRKIMQEVLFPNYLFVQFDQTVFPAMAINHTRGVNSLVSFGQYPTQIPDQLIQQLQQRFETNRPELISNLPEKGDRLQVLDGPFRGLNAVFSQIDGDSRAVVLLTILKQKVRAVLPFSSLAPITRSSRREL